MQIRSLDPIHDRALVDAFYADSADYIWLEREAPPGPDLTEEYFTDAPPGCDPAASLRLGLFHAGLIGIAEMSFGFPEPTDAYIGLMMIAPRARGRGAGITLLRHLEAEARRRGCPQVYLGVLDANPRGRAFWEREGFRLALPNRPVTLGSKTQIAHRLVKALPHP